MRHKKGRRGFCKAIGAMLFGGLATKVVKGRPETKEPDKTRVDTCGASGNGQYSIRCDLHNYGYDKPDDDKRKDWKLCVFHWKNGEVHIVKVLEGKKENLEYVLQTIAGTRTRGDRDI
ncbi:hypothetical protein LCGC14_1303880 [marine sediment metagenome]|uniref:Uncharacterized protein n=1 Tax=marine sediment metagenome TaxID=412755 RepID=A0A0F9KP86_9ZZZZ